MVGTDWYVMVQLSDTATLTKADSGGRGRTALSSGDLVRGLRISLSGFHLFARALDSTA